MCVCFSLIYVLKKRDKNENAKMRIQKWGIFEEMIKRDVLD